MTKTVTSAVATRPCILLCADASPTIGSGHVRRVLTLASAIDRAGGRPLLSVNEDGAATLASALGAAGLPVLPRPAGVPAMARAARQTPDAAWVLLDTYDASASTEADFSGLPARLAVIDDLADRAHACDLLIDQNAHHSAASYRAVSPGARRLLIGPRYAMLRPSFARLRPSAPVQRRLERVFLSFGGFDPLSLLPVALDALLAHPDLNVTVACSPAAPSVDRLRAQARANPARVRLLLGADDIAGEMAQCQAAVGAGGTMVWERACLGLPGLVLVIADNQEGVCAWLDAQQLAPVIDARDGLELHTFSAALDAFLADKTGRADQAARAHALVDGDGADRVAHALLNAAVEA